MNKKILLMIGVVSTISLHGMNDDKDKQLTSDMAALEINKDKVDTWDALGKDKKKEVKSTLEKWAKKYNEYCTNEAPDRVVSEEQLQKAVKKAYIAIKIDIRRDEGVLPTNPTEAEEKKYYYDAFLKGEIQAVRFPGAVCSFGLKAEVVSDSEDEDTDKK